MVLSPMQLNYFDYNQKMMLSTAQALNLDVDDLDLDPEGKLVIRPAALGSDRGVSRGSEVITVHDLYVGGDSMIRADDTAAARVGVAPFRYPWEPHGY